MADTATPTEHGGLFAALLVVSRFAFDPLAGEEISALAASRSSRPA